MKTKLEKGIKMAEYFEKETVFKEIFSIYEREFPTASGAFDEFVTKTVPNILACIPSADVAPVRIGFWEIGGVNPTNNIIGNFKCSLCKGTSLEDSDYCPNCGAKMEG